MTRSVYVMGGAGSGKSTFTAQLLEGLEFGPLIDLHAKRNAKALVTLRGHRVGAGMYLGAFRDEFPGSDGLDRASSPTAEEWLQNGDLPPFIVSEGATLATRRFLSALHRYTDLLLVHLYCDPVVADLRFLQRGSTQNEKFVANTVTRSQNLLEYMVDLGCQVLDVDSANPEQWIIAKELCRETLLLAEVKVE